MLSYQLRKKSDDVLEEELDQHRANDRLERSRKEMCLRITQAKRAFEKMFPGESNLTVLDPTAGTGTSGVREFCKENDVKEDSWSKHHLTIEDIPIRRISEPCQHGRRKLSPLSQEISKSQSDDSVSMLPILPCIPKTDVLVSKSHRPNRRFSDPLCLSGQTEKKLTPPIYLETSHTEMECLVDQTNETDDLNVANGPVYKYKPLPKVTVCSSEIEADNNSLLPLKSERRRKSGVFSIDLKNAPPQILEAYETSSKNSNSKNDISSAQSSRSTEKESKLSMETRIRKKSKHKPPKVVTWQKALQSVRNVSTIDPIDSDDSD